MSCEIKVNFELTKSFTWGITKDKKFSGFSVPVVIKDPEIINQINELANDHGAKNPLYGNNPEYKTLYLKCNKLSEKQTQDLYNQGKQNILIHFQAFEVKTSQNDTKYLKFKITKLQKVEYQTAFQDEYPED